MLPCWRVQAHITISCYSILLSYAMNPPHSQFTPTKHPTTYTTGAQNSQSHTHTSACVCVCVCCLNYYLQADLVCCKSLLLILALHQFHLSIYNITNVKSLHFYLLTLTQQKNKGKKAKKKKSHNSLLSSFLRCPQSC